MSFNELYEFINHVTVCDVLLYGDVLLYDTGIRCNIVCNCNTYILYLTNITNITNAKYN